MQLSDFEIYKTFYEFRNLSEVATRVNLSQPSVSYRLKRISQELGVELYRYDGHYHFTDNGIRFYESSCSIAKAYHTFLDTVEHRRELHVSLSSIATAYYMDTIFDLLQEEKWYPVISTTSSAETIRRVADGESAFGVVGGVHNTRMPTGLEKRRIVNEEIVLAFNASLPDDIRYIPILLDDRDSGLNPLAVEYLEKHVSHRVVGEIGKSFQKLRLVAKHPIGIFIPTEYRRYVEANHKSEIRLSKKYFFQRDLYLVYNERNHTALVDTLIQKLNKLAQSIR